MTNKTYYTLTIPKEAMGDAMRRIISASFDFCLGRSRGPARTFVFKLRGDQYAKFMVKMNEYYNGSLDGDRTGIPCWATNVEVSTKESILTIDVCDTKQRHCLASDKERIEFILPASTTTCCGTRRPQGFVNLLKDVFDADINRVGPKVTIRCRPSQFSKWLIKRNELGFKNNFMELDAHYVDTVPHVEWDCTEYGV